MAKFSTAILLALASAAQFGWATDIAAPTRDRYPGLLEIHVNATDIDHRIVSVQETMPVKAGPMVLLYPECGPGYHAPIRNMTQFAGLKLSANGNTIAWTRDPQDMGTFHLTIPNGVAQIRAEFQYLTPIPPARGLQEVTNSIVKLQFTSLLLYPAGFKTDGIQTAASVRLPEGWGVASSLEPADSNADLTIYRTVDLTTFLRELISRSTRSSGRRRTTTTMDM